MNATTTLGIASIVVAFFLFSASFYCAVKGRKRASISFGVIAFLFMTVIPVSLALFSAVPNPHEPDFVRTNISAVSDVANAQVRFLPR